MAETGPAKTNIRQFAVVNVAELLERSAYYGFTSVFSLYLLLELGYSGTIVGGISAILLAGPYLLPLLTGALAEKLGYKPMMSAALVLYISGFATLWLAPGLPGVLTGVTLIAFGAGGFKPVATASVAHLTSESHRSLGYTIYYTGINVGGFLGPLAVAFLAQSYRTGFALSGAILIGALLLTLLLFRNPVPPQSDVRLKQALAKLGAIFEDSRLLDLLLIFSGFWFLYSMNFSFLAPYLERFVPHPDWFQSSLQQAFNPLVIILLGIPLGSLATKREPVRMMSAGIGLYLVGFSLVAFVPVFPIFFAGLFIATVGEILAYPAFLAFIARIAPPDRVAIYQSYGFVPICIGFLFGPILSGPAYQAFAVEAGQPWIFWLLPLAMGALALVGMLFAAARAKRPAKPRSQGANKALAGLLLVLLLAAPVLVVLLSSDEPEVEQPPLGDYEFTRQSGTNTEGGTSTRTVAMAGAEENVTVELTWNDEAATIATTANQPDTLRLRLETEGVPLAQQQAANPVGQPGRIALTVPANALLGNLTVHIALVSAGDFQTNGITVSQDTTVAWQLVVAGQRRATTS